MVLWWDKDGMRRHPLGTSHRHCSPNAKFARFIICRENNASKTALNVYTVHLANELNSTTIKVNSAHPGWAKTELGGEYALMEVADSYKTSLMLATLSDDGPTGGFFHEGDTLPW